MSEFVSARLGLNGVQSRHKRCILVRARMALRPVGSSVARVALHQSACSRGCKLSREGADPRSLRGRGVCCLSEACVPHFCVHLKESVLIHHHESTLDVAPASPFIVSKGRARVTFVVKM
jgi:hypothetical protein